MTTTKFNLMEAMEQKGFERIENPYAKYGCTAEYYERTWGKDIELAWGRGAEHFEMTVTAIVSRGNVRFIYSTGKVKDHALNKRAWNALRDTVTFNGYEF